MLARLRACEFQPTLPARGATQHPVTQPVTQPDFNPRSPRGERPQQHKAQLCGADFNPRSPRGERPFPHFHGFPSDCNFNPRSPRGERQMPLGACATASPFQPTLPARGATRRAAEWAGRRQISTHAPREGSDDKLAADKGRHEHFNPRSPRGERRPPKFLPACKTQFQPTLPARGATKSSGAHRNTSQNFNPRSPRGERRSPTTCARSSRSFQPTLPARGATFYIMSKEFNKTISTHERPCSSRHPCIAHPISTHAPREGSDHLLPARLSGGQISTHAPREGSDNPGTYKSAPRINFNPRSPRGERRSCPCLHYLVILISTHAPREGSDPTA